MTQAQFDLQNQLEQTDFTDLTTQFLFNDSPVLFLEVMDQAPSVVNREQNPSTERTEHPIPPEKHLTPPATNNFAQSHGISQPNKYEQSHGTTPS